MKNTVCHGGSNLLISVSPWEAKLEELYVVVMIAYKFKNSPT